MQLFVELIDTMGKEVQRRKMELDNNHQSLQDLFAELELRMAAVNLEGVVGPGQPLDEAAGEKALGVMSEELKRFWVVRSTMLDELHAECSKSHSEVFDMLMETPLSELESKVPELVGQHHKAHERMDEVNKVFWLAVEHDFPELANAGGTTLRQGWQVVAQPANNGPRIIVGSPIEIPESLARVIAEALGVDGIVSGSGGKKSHKKAEKKVPETAPAQ